MTDDAITDAIRSSLRTQGAVVRPPVGHLKRRANRQRIGRATAVALTLAVLFAGGAAVAGRESQQLEAAAPSLTWTVRDGVADAAAPMVDGVTAHEVDGVRFFLVRTGDVVVAFSTNVQHLARERSLSWCPVEREFVSATHGERFDAEGNVLGGPAARGLDRHRAEIVNGRVRVHLHDLTLGEPRTVTSDFEPDWATYCRGAIHNWGQGSAEER